jgi:hypothetical protein
LNTPIASSSVSSAQRRRSHPFGDLGAVRRFIVPVSLKRSAVVETVLFMLAVLFAGWLFDRDDPLLLHAQFPSLWLAVLVVALRYGTLLGLLGAALLALAWKLFAHAGEPWPLLFFVGGLVQTIVVGHFGDTWNKRATRANAINDYLNDRLVAITNSHYLLRLSHERLERDLLARPTTLRDSIAQLRALSVSHGLGESAQAEGDAARSTPLHGARELLEFVAQACQIDVAALYPVSGGQLAAQPVASVGDAFELDARDPFVVRALETLSVVHLRSDGASASSRQTELVACAPLVAADGKPVALFAVKRMPFMSLNFDNLQLLLVLLGYYADGVEHAVAASKVLDVVPDCPHEFALEVSRLARLQREAGIPSSLVALSFPHDDGGASLLEHVMRRRRTLDLMWAVEGASRHVLVKLMPATDAAGVDGYLARIESSLRAQYKLDLDSAGIGVHTLHIHGDEPGLALRGLLERSGIHG